jgi:hypothetical protein
MIGIVVILIVSVIIGGSFFIMLRHRIQKENEEEMEVIDGRWRNE